MKKERKKEERKKERRKKEEYNCCLDLNLKQLI